MGQLTRVTPGLWETRLWGENFPSSIRLELSHRLIRGVSFFAFVRLEQIFLYRPGERMGERFDTAWGPVLGRPCAKGCHVSLPPF